MAINDTIPSYILVKDNLEILIFTMILISLKLFALKFTNFSLFFAGPDHWILALVGFDKDTA